jgi:hypothetical protein
MNANYSMVIDGPDPRGPAVVGRHVFYNRSAYDGNDPAANSLDDGAIARDKWALLPGRAAQPADVSAYALGINGLMIDIAGRRGLAAPTVDDFVLDVGNGTTWSSAPRPRSFGFRGGGTGGSDRATIVFGDNAVRNTWLRVTVRATERTGLAAPDVFYYGNLAGNVGGRGSPRVDATDLALVRENFGKTTAAALATFDVNRDGKVNAADVAVVRANQRHSLLLFAAPAAASASAGAWTGPFRDTPVSAPPARDALKPSRRGLLGGPPEPLA